MPEQGVDLTPNEKLLSLEELRQLVSLFVRAGVDKVRLTGGEPTVRADLENIVSMIRSHKEIKSIGMTTNGLVLKHKLRSLKEAGLDVLNISLDTFVEAKFTFLTRRLGFKKVMESIDLALKYGYRPLKLNCVMMRGVNDDEVYDFVEFTRSKDVYVRFIEYMPFDGNQWNDKKLVPYAEMLEKIKLKYKLSKVGDAENDTSKAFQVDGYKGKIGFITSMTDHFCGTCNRIRLTADGNLKVCLFSNKEYSLRDMLREGKSNQELYEVISNAIKGKKYSHDGMYNIAGRKNRPMITIGG
jgi:molybdenum cofactor biosynthesis protein A